MTGIRQKYIEELEILKKQTKGNSDMRKKKILMCALAAALFTSAPVSAFADTQISLEGPSGESSGNMNGGQSQNENGISMAGPGGSSGNSWNVGQNGQNNQNNQNTQINGPGAGSVDAVPSEGPGSVQDNTSQGNNDKENHSQGSTSSPNSGENGNHAATQRDGSSPEKALIYATGKQTQQNTGETVSRPTVQSEGAYLYNATTGEVLFEKNADTKFYPASITKLMTGLLVLENSSLDDVVTYHSSAVDHLESGAVKLGLTEGDQLTVKDSMYALFLKSANDVASGLAEYIGGSEAGFLQMMNDRARALGCTNTNFANANGLNNVNHYTTPHDMALIAAEAFKNPTLCEINSTLSYKIPATKKVTTERMITLGHKMFFKNDSRYYEGIIGGKTGYTSKAGNTLVTCVERDGVRLIAVILKSSQSHYQDTRAMLDYGFAKVKEQNNKDDAAKTGTWKQNEYGWYFLDETGRFVKDIWMEIDGKTYLFDRDGYMATRWQKMNNGEWYYFGESGSMKKECWVETSGQWYYMSKNGTLFTNGVTPDGYFVNEFGIWKQF